MNHNFDAWVEAVDRICQAAKTISHSPFAFINLFDSNFQWSNSGLGHEVFHTFCSHTISQNGNNIFVVSNALEDERFNDRDLVQGQAGICFYAGVSLVLDDSNGCPKKLGTLCIVDLQPRHLEDHHRLVMETLAKLVVSDIKRLRGDCAAPVQESHPACCPIWREAECADECGQRADEGAFCLTANEAEAMWLDLLRQHQCETPVDLDYDGDTDAAGSEDGGCEEWICLDL